MFNHYTADRMIAQILSILEHDTVYLCFRLAGYNRASPQGRAPGQITRPGDMGGGAKCGRGKLLVRTREKPKPQIEMGQEHGAQHDRKTKREEPAEGDRIPGPASDVNNDHVGGRPDQRAVSA